MILLVLIHIETDKIARSSAPFNASWSFPSLADSDPPLDRPGPHTHTALAGRGERARPGPFRPPGNGQNRFSYLGRRGRHFRDIISPPSVTDAAALSICLPRCLAKHVVRFFACVQHAGLAALLPFKMS